MRKTHNFRELIAWQKSRDVVKSIYELTKLYPKEELFSLTSQMRRASISIPSNIAEGCGRGTNPQLVQFLTIALGSSFELETQLILSADLNYVNQVDIQEPVNKLHEVQNLIYSLKVKFDETK
jgi:four helix bundle protein